MSARKLPTPHKYRHFFIAVAQDPKAAFPVEWLAERGLIPNKETDANRLQDILSRDLYGHERVEPVCFISYAATGYGFEQGLGLVAIQSRRRIRC